jgi:predicted transcriptional regulator
MAKEIKTAQIVAACSVIYARVARKMNISPSMVSKVASGTRRSAEIEAALQEELKQLKKKLDSHFD